MTTDPYTAIPNWLIEAMPQMPASTFQVACVIARQTLGYSDGNGGRREWDRISLSQLQSATGLSRLGVQKAIAAGLGKWFERREDGQWYEYKLCNSVTQLDAEPVNSVAQLADEVGNSVNQATELTRQLSCIEVGNSVAQFESKVGNSVYPQKKDIKKQEKEGETRARDPEPPAAKPEPLPPHLANMQHYLNGGNPHPKSRLQVTADTYTEQARKLGIEPRSMTQRVDALAGCVGKLSRLNADTENDGLLNSLKQGVLVLARLGHHTEADYRRLCEAFADANTWMDSPVPTLDQLLDFAGKLKDGVVDNKPKSRLPKLNQAGFYDFQSMAEMKAALVAHPDIAGRVTVRGTQIHGATR